MNTKQNQKRNLAKVILLGDSGVGKTSLMNRYVNQKFSTQYKATIGADFLSKELQTTNSLINLQIWDTAGRERFQSSGSAFYRGADAVIIIIDVTSRETLGHTKNWIEDFKIQNGSDENVVFALVANKCDLENHRQVTTEEIAKCAKDNGFHFFIETSAKEATNVEMLFSKIGLTYEEVSKRRDISPTPIPGIILDPQPSKKPGWFDWCSIL